MITVASGGRRGRLAMIAVSWTIAQSGCRFVHEIAILRTPRGREARLPARRRPGHYCAGPMGQDPLDHEVNVSKNPGDHDVNFMIDAILRRTPLGVARCIRGMHTA
jgi:hypothetical protein